jgi:hypothetical protein
MSDEFAGVAASVPGNCGPTIDSQSVSCVIMVLMHRDILPLRPALSFLSLKSPIHVPRRSVFWLPYAFD